MISSIVNAEVDYLARFEHNNQVSYGRISGQNIQPLSGDFFGELIPNGQAVLLVKVKFNAPN